MKRLLILGAFVMVFTMFTTAQELQRGDATWYEVDGISLRANHATLPFGTRIRITNLNNNRQTIVQIGGRIPNEPDRILDISQEAAKNLGMTDGTAGIAKTPITIEVLGGRTVAAAEPPPPPPEPVVEPPPPPPPPAPEPVVEPPPPPPPPPAPEPVVVQAPAPSSGTVINIYITGDFGRVTAEEPVAAAEPPPPPQPPASRLPAATVYPKMPDPRSNGIYRVQVGSFLSPLNAQHTFERLKAAGFNPAYEKYEEYYRVVLSGIRASDMQLTAQQLGNLNVKEVWIRQEY